MHYTIGEFSKMTSLLIKSLRLNHEKGLLIPQHVDELQGGRCVSLIHKGPYEMLNESYRKIFAYIKEKGYKTVLPSREVYLKGPGMIFKGNPTNYLTEIQLFLKE